MANIAKQPSWPFICFVLTALTVTTGCFVSGSDQTTQTETQNPAVFLPNGDRSVSEAGAGSRSTPTPEPTPTPNPVADPTPTATPSPTATPTSTPTATPTATPSPTPSSTPLSTPTPSTTAITPIVHASLVSGPAPLGVSFDGRSSSGLFGNDFVGATFIWNFGDSNAGTWTYSGKSKNRATGFIAAHIYETPGVYTASLQIIDAAGNVSQIVQIPIEVLDPQQVYTQTFCVSNVGNDASCAPNAQALQTLAQVTANLGPNRKFLFKRGDTWTSPQGLSFLSDQGFSFFGAYGSGDKPRWIFPTTNVEGFVYARGHRLVFQDLELIGPDAPHNGGASHGLIVMGTRVLLHRMHIHGFDRNVVIMGSFQQAGSALANIVSESILHRSAYFSMTTESVSERAHIMGNHFYDTTQGHLRLLESRATQIVHNRFDDSFSVKSHSQETLITDNFFNGGSHARIAYGTGGSLEPCDTASKQHHLVERNIFNGVSTHYSGGVNGVVIECGGDFMVRNNIYIQVGNSVRVDGTQLFSGFAGALPVRIYNNLAYDGRGSTHASRFLSFSANHPAMDIRNNLVNFPQLNFRDGDYTSAIHKNDTHWNGVGINHNLWHLPNASGPSGATGGLFALTGAYPNQQGFSSTAATPSTVQYFGTLNPLSAWQQGLGFDQHTIFSNPLLVDPANGDFRLQNLSPARNAGAPTVPVYLDFDLNLRGAQQPLSIGPFF